MRSTMQTWMLGLVLILPPIGVGAAGAERALDCPDAAADRTANPRAIQRPAR